RRWLRRSKYALALNGPVQSDTAEDVGIRVNFFVAHVLQQASEIIGRQETTERIRDVRIGSRAAVKDGAPESAVRIKVSEIKLARETIWRKKEIEAQQQAARTSHA